MNVKRFALFAAPALIWAAFIFFLSSQSDLPHGPPIPHLDKVAHLGEYGIFGLAIARGFIAYGFSPRRSVLLAFALGALYGASDEFHQSYVPKRTAEVGDAVADAAGGGLGGVSWAVFAAFMAKRRALAPEKEAA